MYKLAKACGIPPTSGGFRDMPIKLSTQLLIIDSTVAELQRKIMTDVTHA